MPLTVVCDQCGKAYAADESLAGRRIRCRGCGHIVTVPRNDSADDGPNMDALADLERSFSGDAAATHAGTGAGIPAPQIPHMPGTPETIGLEGENIENAGRANLRFNFAGAKELDMALPWLLTGGAGFWLLVQAARTAPKDAGWTAFTGSLFWLGAYTLIIWPLVFIALRAAGRSVGFQLPRTARWRTFACYLPAIVLTATMWMIGLGAVKSMLIGTLGGLIVASFSVYVLFRLQGEEVATTAGYGAGGYIFGLILAVLAMVGLNRLGAAIVESTGSTAIAASPLGPGFDWAKGDPRRAETEARNRTRVSVADRIDPNSIAPAPVAPVRAGPPEVTAKLTGEASSAASIAFAAGLPTGPVIDTGPQVVRPKSPLVADFSPASLFRKPVDRYVYSITDSPFVATMQRSGDNLEFLVWDSRNWTAVNAKPISVRGTQGLEDFTISPDGKKLARTSTFLQREVEIYDVTNPGAKPLTVPLDSAGTILAGILPADRLLVTADAGGGTKIDLFDLVRRRNARQQPLQLPAPEGIDKSLNFTAGAKFAAVASRDDRGKPAIRFFAMGAERSVSSHTAGIASLPADWPTTPAGFAVSTDSEKPEETYAAVLYEHMGGAILQAYRQSSESKAGEYIDRNARLPRRPPEYTGPALRWIGTGKNRYVLVYGKAVVDLMSAEFVGEIDVEGVTDLRVIDAQNILLMCKSDRHPIPVRVKLNLERAGTSQ